MVRVRRLLLPLLGLAVFVGGCGGQTKTVTIVRPTAVAPKAHAQASVPCPPPPGEGFMGACAPSPVQVFPGGVTAPLLSNPSGGRFVDVSSWQGRVNWSAIVNWQRQHGWHTGGVFKIGEFGIDPYASTNNSQLRALHAFRAGYWFVRNTGCASEAGQIINEARALGLTVVIEDDEVPEAAGYSTCLTPRLKAAGFTVLIYTSPGSWPGGSGGVDAWMAAFGSVLPRSPFGGAIKAWQCTNGISGCVTSVPGVGRIDTSIDYGMLSLGQAPPDPYAVFQKTVYHFGNVTASEYNTYKTWVTNKCRRPAKRAVCKSSYFHAKLLWGRMYFVATHRLTSHGWVAVHPTRWSYGEPHHPLGTRFALYSHTIVG